MQKYIYIIQLAENKRLIHFSEKKPESQLFKECEIYYDFVKKYEPIYLEETIPLLNYVDIDTHVKWHMFLYGIHNVKGGSYIEDPLPEHLEKSLNQEFRFIERENLECAKPFSEILEKYEHRDYHSLEEIEDEISKTNAEFQKYLSEKERLEKMKKIIGSGKSLNTPSMKMKWLYEYCCIKTFQYESNLLQINNIESIERNLKSEQLENYRKIIEHLKHIILIFEEFNLFAKYSIEKTVELKYPQFVFDDFVYHIPSEHKLDQVKELCQTFQFMWDVVYNMICEFEFDVSSYGEQFEWKVPRILYILEKKKLDLEKCISKFTELSN